MMSLFSVSTLDGADPFFFGDRMFPVQLRDHCDFWASMIPLYITNMLNNRKK